MVCVVSAIIAVALGLCCGLFIWCLRVWICLLVVIACDLVLRDVVYCCLTINSVVIDSAI